MVAHPGTHRLGGAGFYRKRSLDQNLVASGQILGLTEPRPTILGPRRIPGRHQNKLVAEGSGRPHFCQFAKYSALGRQI
jgi:hypothetical protein